MAKVYKLTNNKRDTIKKKCLDRIKYGFDSWNAPKKASKIEQEMYEEVKNASDIEKHIKDNVQECGMKGRYYRDLLKYYNYLCEDYDYY